MAEILEYFKDINFMYNDCSMHDTLAKMLSEFESEIRAKAIDEFAEKLKEASIRGSFEYKPDKENPFHKVRSFCNVVGTRKIDEIAEQLKGVE